MTMTLRQLRALPLFLAFALMSSHVDLRALEYNMLTICNDGNTRMWVATVSKILGFFGSTYQAEGWWTIDPGVCKRVFSKTDAVSFAAYVTAIYRDRNGRRSIVPMSNPDDRFLDKSERTFCMPFNRVEFNLQADLERDTICPADVRPPDFETVSFPLWFRVVNYRDNTLRLRPDLNVPSMSLIAHWN